MKFSLSPNFCFFFSSFEFLDTSICGSMPSLNFLYLENLKLFCLLPIVLLPRGQRCSYNTAVGKITPQLTKLWKYWTFFFAVTWQLIFRIGASIALLQLLLLLNTFISLSSYRGTSLALDSQVHWSLDAHTFNMHCRILFSLLSGNRRHQMKK